MSVLPVGIGSEVGAGGYQIERSLRFNSADSAYLNRTPSSTGNRQKWTLSFWAKFTSLANNYLFGAGDVDTGGGSGCAVRLNSNSTMKFVAGGAITMNIDTVQVFRDPSAWYHIVLALDTTQATNTNRVKIYVNGVESSLSATTWPSQNTNLDWNYASATQYLGAYYGSGLNYSNCYLTEINNIDGSALDPTSFGEFNEDTGVWQPKAYTGSYGTNGFYLDFADNSGTTSTTLGADSSGNGNNWTPNNFSVTAGAGNDSLVDTPTPYGEDTGVGGEVRGNYNTINVLDKGSGLNVSNGNLDHIADSSGNWYQSRGTIAFPSTGKWYWEITFNAGTNSWCSAGMAPSTIALTMGFGPGTYGNYYGMTLDGTLYANNASTGSYGSAFSSGDVLMVAFDRDNSKIYFGRNGTWFNSSNPATQTNPAASSISTTATLFTSVGGVNSSGGASNHGQRPFSYTAPSGFKALCTQNLPEPTIVDGGEYFNTVLYTGNGSTQSITGVGFQPDLVWAKSRSTADANFVLDAVRGATQNLYTNGTAAEFTQNTVTAFNADGFSVGSQANGVNTNGNPYVAWNWKANGAGVSNTNGTITSTVSASTDSGFSIVSYAGTGANATVGHGLGVAPAMVIVKNRTTAVGWGVMAQAANSGSGHLGRLLLNETASWAATNEYWNNTAPTSSVFSVGINSITNASSANLVAYCFAPVSGFSSMGSYVGNGSADGPFVYTGFRPRWVMLKRTDGVAGWVMFDTARDPYNVMQLYLYANFSNAEATAAAQVIDTLSNGFKMRGTDSYINGSGASYIYIAFAENPFAYSLAR